eukprot:m.560444 g.560444  ORF g.560444 m.560444 type:complete len:501 (-) comp22210_c0_seq21:1766-3268(-)
MKKKTTITSVYSLLCVFAMLVMQAQGFRKHTGTSSAIFNYSVKTFSEVGLTATMNLNPVFSIISFGAVGDNVTINTASIQAAIDACHLHHPSGCTVLVPAGNFRTASISLRSNMRLHLAAGAALFGSRNASDYAISLQWFGGHCAYNFNALIFAHNLTNVSITGSNDAMRPGNASIVDGVGWKWWCEAQCMPIYQPWCDKFNPTHETLPRDLLPSPQGAGRPRLVNVFNCTNVTLAGFTAQNSPHWTLHIQNSDRVLIQNMTVLSPRSVGNTDGIDPESSSNVVVKDSYIDVGDDGISIKSYNITIDGQNTMVPCRDITLQRLHVLSRNWCIGSGTFGGVYNILFEDSVVGRPSRGAVPGIPVPWAFKFKSHQYFPGPIENVTVRRIQVGPVAATPWMYNDTRKVFQAFELGLTYGGNAPPVHWGAPLVRNITFADIHIEHAGAPGGIVGLPLSCMSQLTFRNVTFGSTGTPRWACKNVDNQSLVTHQVNPPITNCMCPL